jgi:hypothetical protein
MSCPDVFAALMATSVTFLAFALVSYFIQARKDRR